MRKIVDPHHHLWDLEAHHYAWLQDRPPRPSVAGDIRPIATTYGVEEFRKESAAFDLVKSVHVETGWDPSDPAGETRWLQGVADSSGFPQGIVAFARLEDPAVERVLEAHRAFRNLRGVRQILNWHPDPKLTFTQRSDLLRDAQWQRGYRLLKNYGLSFDLQIYPWQMEDAARVIAAQPEIPVILNHAGMPLYRDPDGIAVWRKGMRMLAALPHVSVKISGIGMVDWGWTVESIRPIVRESIEIFGIDRAMFASNFPVDRLYSGHAELYQAFEASVADLPETDQRSLFTTNAERIYRI